MYICCCFVFVFHCVIIIEFDFFFFKYYFLEQVRIFFVNKYIKYTNNGLGLKLDKQEDKQ